MVTFGDEVTKIRKYQANLYLHYARQDGQDGKKPERKSPNLCDQNIKKQRTKIWKERNIDPDVIQIVYRNQNEICFETFSYKNQDEITISILLNTSSHQYAGV